MRPSHERRKQALACAIAVVLASCATTERATTERAATERSNTHSPRAEAPSRTTEPVQADTQSSPQPATRPSEPAAAPVLIVSDPDVLARLEARGFDLGSAWLGSRAHSTRELSAQPPYRALVRMLEQDLARDARRDPKAGVGMRHAHRQFDLRWLDSDRVRFELIGVINRIDRRPFAPEHCGEIRFLYRLAYSASTASGPMQSRLPMTLNLVDYQAQERGGCTDVARRWLAPVAANSPDSQLAWLLSNEGPLGASARAGAVPKSLELNLQSVRWPSTVRPKMAGHAEYGLRALARKSEPPYLAPLPLENTVDSERIARDPTLRAELLALVRAPESLRAIDEGTVQLPERFLATHAVSVSPHGLARAANRPFSQVFKPSELESLELASFEHIKTPRALLRRLDTLSCSGCHQSRSLAGFHMLGVEPESDTVDALAVPMSPHLHADLDRRASYVLALVHGKVPSERRPPAERGDLIEGASSHAHAGHPAHGLHAGEHAHAQHAQAQHAQYAQHAHAQAQHAQHAQAQHAQAQHWQHAQAQHAQHAQAQPAHAAHVATPGGRGEHCGLGDPGFAAWSCAAGLRCERLADDEVGACVSESARSVGEPCERGTMRASSHPHRDAITLLPQDACAGGRVCEENAVGFPSGLCAGGCEDLPEGATCGGIALLREFNACLANKTPFDRCLAEHTRPGALAACDARTPCRDDYVCVRMAGKAACLPPYFLFQARVDGHAL